MERIQCSPRVASKCEQKSRRDLTVPKGCVPLGTYRVEETKGLIDGMGTVRLAETNGHNESIEDH